MKTRVLILGAGFAGLELATILSATLRDEVDVTMIDRSDSFYFGFSKLEVLLGRRTSADIKVPYSRLAPAITFKREEITSIDPQARHVVTEAATYDPDILVVALGADYAPEATPGFVEDGYEFYSLEGAERLRDHLRAFAGGRVVIAILKPPFQCPPAPYEGAFLIRDLLEQRSVSHEMTLITPMPSPIPVSEETSEVIVRALHERGIAYRPSTWVDSIDPATHTAHLRGGEGVPYDLFIGIPAHRVPDVVKASGLTEGGSDGWIAVDPKTLATPYPGVYGVGDCADAPVPRAGVFAEDAARTAAEHIIASVRGTTTDTAYKGMGTCYLEMGGGLVGKVEANFLGGPSPVVPFAGPSTEFAAEKERFAADHESRWFAG